jgi:pimeloyl-ACP methyl ester carboxylesterase
MKLLVQGRAAYAYTGGKPFDAAQKTMVFVHGAVGDHGAFNLLARWYAHHGWSVLAVDLPAHMRSDGPALGSVEVMAAWLLELLQVAQVRQCVLAGHSMGSLIALEAASTLVQTDSGIEITHLVMFGTCVPMPVPQALLDLGRKDLPAALDRVTMFSYASMAPKPSFPGPGVWLHGAGRRLMQMVCDHARTVHEEPDLFYKDFSACHAYHGGLNAAEKVAASGRCQAHLILGRRDQMTLPQGAQALQAALQAQRHWTASGHVPMAEDPHASLHAMHEAGLVAS